MRKLLFLLPIMLVGCNDVEIKQSVYCQDKEFEIHTWYGDYYSPGHYESALYTADITKVDSLKKIGYQMALKDKITTNAR